MNTAVASMNLLIDEFQIKQDYINNKSEKNVFRYIMKKYR